MRNEGKHLRNLLVPRDALLATAIIPWAALCILPFGIASKLFVQLVNLENKSKIFETKGGQKALCMIMKQKDYKG